MLPDPVHEYKSGKMIGLAAQICLGLYCCISALEGFTGFPAMHYALEKDLEQTTVFENGLLGMGCIDLVLLLITGVLFIVWLRRMRNNLSALAVTDLRSKGWQVIFSWAIPIYFLWKPFQVVDEVWKASDPQQLGNNWQSIKTSPLLMFWWGFYLLMHFCIKVSDFMSSLMTSAKDTFGAVAATGLGYIICAPPSIVAAVLAILLIHDINTRQQVKAGALNVIPRWEK